MPPLSPLAQSLPHVRRLLEALDIADRARAAAELRAAGAPPPRHPRRRRRFRRLLPR